MQYLKRKHMICLDETEAKALYGDAKRFELLKAMEEKNVTLLDLIEDNSKMQDLVTEIASKTSNSKEELEIFASVFCYLEFYPQGSKVCFVLEDSVNPSNISITCLADLMEIIKEYTMTDFGIFSDDGLREFQLKQFKGELNTETLFKDIANKIERYGHNLGDTNLLLVLQSEDGDLGEVDFEELCNRINKLDFKSEAGILISYNENNNTNVINTVYPKLETTRVPTRLERLM